MAVYYNLKGTTQPNFQLGKGGVTIDTISNTGLGVQGTDLVLNNNVTGTPASNASLVVERGTSANVAIRWNESTDTWEYTNDGSSYSALGGISGTLDDLTDVDLTGAANNDLLYRSAGNWIDTAGLLTWDGSTLLATAGTISGASVVALSNTLEVQGSYPFLQLNQTDGGTNEKKWVWIYDNTALEMRAVNDASSAYSQAFVMSRSGYAISSLIFGNATDNPTFTFSGTGLTTVGGALTVVGAVNAKAGTVSSPSINFSDATTGFYKATTDSIGVTIAGTQRLIFDSTGIVTASAKFYGPGGSAAAPTYSFVSDSNSGMYGNNSGEVYLVSDGTSRLTVNSSGATVNGGLSASSVVATSSVMEIQGAYPFLQLNQTDGGTNEKKWVWIADGTALEMRAVNDASDSYTNAFTMVRSGTDVSTITIGNSTSNTALIFPGNPASGPGARFDASGGGTDSAIQINAIQPSINFYESDGGTNAKSWDFTVNSGLFEGRVINDANNTTASWVTVGRSAATIGTLNFYGTSLISNTPAVQIVNTNDTTGTYQLELFQNEGTAVRPISLRFHQGNRYYHRLQATNTGFSMVDGASDSTYSNLSIGQAYLRAADSHITFYETDGADAADRMVFEINENNTNLYAYDNSVTTWRLGFRQNISSGDVSLNTDNAAGGDTFIGNTHSGSVLTMYAENYVDSVSSGTTAYIRQFYSNNTLSHYIIGNSGNFGFLNQAGSWALNIERSTSNTNLYGNLTLASGKVVNAAQFNGSAGGLTSVPTYGRALNQDPGMLDANAWASLSGTATFGLTSDGPYGKNRAISSGAGETTWMNGKLFVPVDPTKTYRVSCWMRTVSGTGSTAYMGVALRTYDGTTISGDGSEWYYAASGVTVPTSWTYYSGLFGANTSKTFPSNGKMMSPLFILSYGGGTCIHEITGLMIEEMSTLDPNTGTYAPWQLPSVSKGSYGGIRDSYSGVEWMFDSSGNGGFYKEGTGWYDYFSVSNLCWGFSGTTTSASYGLYVSDAIYSTGDIVAYSDARAKENVETISDALNKVRNMRGVYYNMIADESKTKKTGVIAQEVQIVLPEAVTYAADVDEYGVNYGSMIGILIEAIKELSDEVKRLKENK